MDRAVDIPYYGYYSPTAGDPKGLIYVEVGGAQPAIREISEVSVVVRGMRGYRIDQACFPVEVNEAILALIADYSSEARVGSGT